MKRVCVVVVVVVELFSDVQDTSAMAYSVSDSNGVCFVPSFSGLQVQHAVSVSVSNNVFAFYILNSVFFMWLDF